MRTRTRKTGIRAVSRITAEKDTAQSFSTWNVSIVVVAEIRCRACAGAYRRHDFAVLSEDYLFDISLVSSFVANVRIAVVVAVGEFLRVITYEHFA